MKTEKRYYVYIMASRSLNLYTGIANDICRRALEHKSGEIEGFTKRYNINRLVYYETFRYVNNAIAREKQIKAWTRAKRIALIKSQNPTWQDLAEGWGEKIELQIPRVARDDKGEAPRTQPEGELEVELQIPRFTRDDKRETAGVEPQGEAAVELQSLAALGMTRILERGWKRHQKF